MQTFGRTTIYSPFTEKQILSLNEEKQKEVVLEIVTNSIGIHQQNEMESLYLKDYLKGIQDIYVEKQKFTREEINFKTVENWAWAMVDFKKNFLLSKPIQYVQLNGSGEEEIAKLNEFMRLQNKSLKDMFNYEDILTCGRGFLFKNYKAPDEDNEAPFEILQCDTENTEVIYSSRLGHEQIGSYIVTSMCYVAPELDEKTGEVVDTKKYYNEYTFYLRNKMFVINDKNGDLEVIGDPTPILMNEHTITEYYTNQYRLSLIEIGKDLFNDINYLESNDKDDMTQFVNAILVFTNVDVDDEDINMMKTLGAICISSQDNKKASIELLQQRLNAQDTQTYYTRLLTSLHQILGVPMASDNGSVSYGDTGKAKLTGQGYTTAGIRAEGDEILYGSCDKNLLKGILKCCKLAPDNIITSLKLSDIKPQFFRDMSENLLTKTQALLNLYSADIPRKFANSLVGLFGDPNAVTTEQQKLFGDQVSQQGSKTVDEEIDVNENGNQNDIIDQQNNNIQDTKELDSQTS